ncbi:MAG: hypothetical protein ACRDTT_11700 [Pseudonocardiaceae bacterium]
MSRIDDPALVAGAGDEGCGCPASVVDADHEFLGAIGTARTQDGPWGRVARIFLEWRRDIASVPMGGDKWNSLTRPE